MGFPNHLRLLFTWCHSFWTTKVRQGPPGNPGGSYRLTHVWYTYVSVDTNLYSNREGPHEGGNGAMGDGTWSIETRVGGIGKELLRRILTDLLQSEEPEVRLVERLKKESSMVSTIINKQTYKPLTDRDGDCSRYFSTRVENVGTLGRVSGLIPY